jgi:hypothetical protein
MSKKHSHRTGRRSILKTALGTAGGALAGYLFYLLVGCTAGGG